MTIHFQCITICRRHLPRQIASLPLSLPLPSKHYSTITTRLSPSTNHHKTTIQQRNKSQSPFEQPSLFTAEYERQRLRRNKNIHMHPAGTGKDILPGNYVIKVNERTGVERKVILEHEKGYFWALRVRV